jgi:hypothetical protein
MRKKSELFDYQQNAIDYLYEHNSALALLPVGAGKSVIGWTTALELMRDGHVKRPLVLAPLRVAQLVWPQERAEWEHLKDADIVAWGGEPSGWPEGVYRDSRTLWGKIVSATARIPKMHDVLKRRELEAKLKQYTVDYTAVNKLVRASEPPRCLHVTSYENLMWVCDVWPPGESPFDLWIFDEIGKLKNPKSPRYKEVKKHTAKVPIVWGLNGTPAPEGFLDLFAQVSIVDGGALWGKSFYKWRQEYFRPLDYKGYKWGPQYGTLDRLTNQLNTVAFKVDETQLSYQKSMMHSAIPVELPNKARELYDEMEKTMSLEDMDITAFSAAAASMKLRQLTQGFVYDEYGDSHVVHGEKAHALADLIDELQGEPLLVAYEFTEDLRAIQRVWRNVPYLGQGVGSSKAEEHVRRWNNRELPVLALHPFCLHPDTLVLTEHRGWVRIVDVDESDRVFDGVEYVTHRGCQLSGVRPVIDCFGIRMTPDHLILVGGTWEKAEDVRHSAEARQKARYANTVNDAGVGPMPTLWGDNRNHAAKRGETQPGSVRSLREVPPQRRPSHDRYPSVENMEGPTGAHDQDVGPRLQTLRWARNIGYAAVARIQELLAGYVERVCGTPDDRARGRERRLLQRELPMGHEHGAAGQQEEQHDRHVSRTRDALGGVLSDCGRDARRDNPLPETLWHRGRGDAGVLEVELPAVESQPQKVYDLVDCGPRRRFAVKNEAGEVFIVHNSAGHGLNLQKGGSHICWYALPWPLESYMQANGRVDRQGQTRACFGHHIVATDTVDQRVSAALRDKAVTQQTIIDAIRRV